MFIKTMERKNIIKGLEKESTKLLKQLEESESPLISEAIIQGANRIKAIDYVLGLLKSGKEEFDDERNELIELIRKGSSTGLPVDILQVIHRLQVLFYTKKLFSIEEDDTSD